MQCRAKRGHGHPGGDEPPGLPSHIKLPNATVEFTGVNTLTAARCARATGLWLPTNGAINVLSAAGLSDAATVAIRPASVITATSIHDLQSDAHVASAIAANVPATATTAVESSAAA